MTNWYWHLDLRTMLGNMAGQSAVEYALLLGLIALLTASSATALGIGTSASYFDLTGSIESAMAVTNVWFE